MNTVLTLFVVVNTLETNPAHTLDSNAVTTSSTSSASSSNSTPTPKRLLVPSGFDVSYPTSSSTVIESDSSKPLDIRQRSDETMSGTTLNIHAI